MRGIRSGFPHGVHAGLQISNQNLALLVGGAVKIMCSVLDFGDTEMYIFQAAPVRAGLNDLQRGLDGIGEHELRVLVGVKLDDTLRLVDDIALAGFFRHHISAGGEPGKVNFAVLVGGKFLGAVITGYGANFKNGVWDDLAGIGAVHLDEPHTGLHIIEEQQLLDAVPCGQLHLLRRGVQDVAVAAGVYLHGAVGAGGSVRQENFAKLVRLKFAERNAVAENLEGDIGHGNHVLAVIFDDPQTGQLLVHKRKGRGFAGGHGSRIGGVVLQPAGGGGDFLNFIGTGLDLIENGIARKIGFSGVGHAALNVLDLYHGSGQVCAGVGQLFNAERTVRLVPAGQLRHLAILHLDVLHGSIADKMVQWGHALIHGVVARQRQRDGHGAVRAGSEGADSGSVGIDHLKNSAAERGIRTLFQLDELQAGVRRFGLFPIAEIAVCGQAHGDGRIGVAHIVLELAVLVDLGAGGIKYRVFINIGGKRKLDAAGLARHRSGRVQHLEFAAVAVPSAGGGDGGNVLIVHIHDARSIGNGAGVREADADGIVAYPCVGVDGEYLLFVLLAIDGNSISGITVSRGSDAGRVHLAPSCAAHIDVLGSGKDGLCPLQFRAGQVGIDLQVIDVPVGKQIAPQRHFGRIVGVIFVFQLQFRKAAGGIAVGDDTHDLRIVALFLGHILDALAGAYRLRHTRCIRIDAVGRDLLRFSVGTHMVKIGIDQLTDSPVDGEVGELLLSVVDIDLAQGFLLAAGGKSGGREHPQHHDHQQQHGDQSFFHVHFLLLLILENREGGMLSHTARALRYEVVSSHRCCTQCIETRRFCRHSMPPESKSPEGRN